MISLNELSFASLYSDPLMTARGLLSTMHRKRKTWRYMLKFAARLYLRRYWRLISDVFR